MLNIKNKKNISARLTSPHFASVLVLINGVLLVSDSLFVQLIHHRTNIITTSLSSYSIEINIVIGLFMIYLSSVLYRAKKTAWYSAVIIYSLTLILNIHRQLFDVHHHRWYIILNQIIMPVFVLALLFLSYSRYRARSDSRSFRNAFAISLIFLSITFIYGVVGFNLLDNSNFHQELSFSQTVQYTVDQLGVTTSIPMEAYTRQGRIFLDSLNLATIMSVIFVILAFFQPLKARFTDQELNRDRFKHLLENDHYATSEDFFRLWPKDKQYFFDSSGFSGLAFRVERGVALILGGPIGDKSFFANLIKEFSDLCYGNDWLVSFIHIDNRFNDLLKKHDFDLQKIGQEAVVDLDKFISSTSRDKYFRNIQNRFNKNGYTSEILPAPHSSAVIARLRSISNDWLKKGRSERGYAMGYFTEEYLNQCDILVARDDAGTIQAFLNIVPASWDNNQATYDMLRFAEGSLGNVNDYLIIKLIEHLKESKFKTLNLGLCPLAGSEEDHSKERGIIDRTMSLVYSNADRFYSFSGLYRFKNKYESEWENRYVAYRGGIRGFSRTMNALIRTMKRSVILKILKN